MAYREDPAGPEVPIPKAQCRGPWSVSFGLYPHRGSWSRADVLAQLEHYRHPFLTVRGTAAGGPLSQGRGLELEGPGVVLSSLRRRDDWLELRLVCERPEPSSAVVTGEFREAREVDLLGRPRRPLSVEAGALRVDLGAWEICTVQLRR